MHEYTKDTIKKLLENGVDTRDENGKTALMLAAWIGDAKLVASILAMGADVNLEDRLGSSVLQFASKQKNIEVLNLIAHSGVDLDKKERDGYQQSAIFTPAKVGNIPVLTFLLDAGANPDITDKFKMTALQWAAQEGKTESIKLLLKYGAEVNTRNNKGITPLISACLIAGIAENVKLLLDGGANINEQSKKGDTAIYYAAYYGYPQIVQLLLEHGADPTLENKRGEDAGKIAEKNKKEEVMAVIANWKNKK